MQWLSRGLKKHWFLIGIVLAIWLAHLLPSVGQKGGILWPEVTIKYVAVSLIFFNSGLSLKTEDLQQALTQYRLHLYIQCFTLMFVPVLMSGIVALLEHTNLDQWLLKGLLVVGSMPPPVSSAVLLTKAAGGNEAGAIFNSAFGSFLGVLVTPTWLLYFLGVRASVPVSKVFFQLSATVVLPLVVGQSVRSHFHYRIRRLNIPYGAISSLILLLIIYTTFCDTFAQSDLSVGELSLLAIVVFVVVFQLAMLWLTYSLTCASVMRFHPSDVVACLFCSTHKSLTLGIPILKALFSNHPYMSLVSIPLLVYHPTQILLGGLLVPSVKAWRETAESFRYSRLLKHV